MSAELPFLVGIEHMPITVSGNEALTLVMVLQYFNIVIEADVIWNITSFVLRFIITLYGSITSVWLFFASFIRSDALY